MSNNFYNEVVFPSEEKLSPFEKVDPSRFVMLQDISSVMLRLQKLRLLKAHEGLFGGKSEVYFISTICDGLSDTPIKVQDADSWKGVKAGGYLDIIDPGVVLYMTQPGSAVPQFIDFRFLVMEDDSDIRDKGQLLQDISVHPGFTSIQSAIKEIMMASNPLIGAAIGLADSAFQLIGSILKGNKDDFIGKGAVTYTRLFDNFGVPAGQNGIVVPSDSAELQIGDAAIRYEIRLG